MDSGASSEAKQRPVQLLTSPTGTPPHPSTSPRTRRPVAFDVPEDSTPFPSAVASTSTYARPYSPAQDGSSDPSQRKRVRSSVDGNPSSRKRSAAHGSPLNPQNTRHTSLSMSVSQGKRRAENAFEVNPMYEEGMDIFQDPLKTNNVLDAKVLELQRRARALGPAPLPPQHKATPPPPSTQQSPKAPQSPYLRQSLDANVASITRPRTVSPLPPNSPLSDRSPSLRALSPSPDSFPSPTSRRPDSLPHVLAPTPEKEGKSAKNGFGHFISDLKWKGKGKEKEDEAVVAQRLAQAEERIAAIKASPIAHDAMLLQRVKTTADQLGRRYGLLFRSLKSGEPPPNPLQVVRWRKQLLEQGRAQRGSRTRQPEARVPNFDLPMINEEPCLDDLYSPAEVESLGWVKCLNTVHLQGHPMRKETMDWNITAGVVEAYSTAAKRKRELDAYDRELGPLHDSPSSGHISLFPARTVSETRATELRGLGVSPRSSTSASSGGRVVSGPNQTFRFPFSSPKASMDVASVSSSSQKSAEGPPSNGHRPPESPRIAIRESTASPAQTAKPRSRRSSLEAGFGGEDQARSPNRRVRNSLPGIIDSSKNSLSQLLSPLSSTSGPRASPIRSHTSPTIGPSRSGLARVGKELEARPQASDGEGSGRSSFSDNPLSPVVSTSDDGRISSSALQKARRRMIGDVMPRRTSGHPPLKELVEQERDDTPSRTASLPHPRIVSPDGLELSTSEDDVSSRRGLGITKAGKKVARSWNALTDRVVKSGLYEDRHHTLNATGASLQPPSGRKPIFRTDTQDTERPGTRSDHLLRAGKRIASIKSRASTQDDEETRQAKKQQQEQREKAVYEQRLSLVAESQRQSAAVNHILITSVRAIADYANRQTALSDSLGLSLEPPLSASIFDLIEPIDPPKEEGWEPVEQYHEQKERRRALLDAYLDSLRPFQRAASADESKILQGIMDLVPEVQRQVEQIGDAVEDLAEEALQVKEMQDEIQTNMDEAEAEFNRVAEKVDTAYPELSRNEELARLLGPDNMTQLLPEWVPDWAQTLLLTISPLVRYLAEFILLSWKHNPFAELLPESWRNSLLQFMLSCIITLWNVTVKIYGFVHYTLQFRLVQAALHWVASFLVKLKANPFPTIFVLFVAWLAFNFVRSADDRTVPASLIVQYSNPSS